jgi:hypothetical protein
MLLKGINTEIHELYNEMYLALEEIFAITLWCNPCLIDHFEKKVSQIWDIFGIFKSVLV